MWRWSELYSRGPTEKALVRFPEKSTIFSPIATKLACKTDRVGGSQGCVQVALADFCRMRVIEADCSQLKPRARGEHLTSQLSWAAVWLLVTCGSPVYLVVDELRPFVLWPLLLGLNGSVEVFFDMVSMVLLIGSWCYSREWAWNLRTKLCCIALAKWNASRVSLQGFDITYIIL